MFHFFVTVISLHMHRQYKLKQFEHWECNQYAWIYFWCTLYVYWLCHPWQIYMCIDLIERNQKYTIDVLSFRHNDNITLLQWYSINIIYTSFTAVKNNNKQKHIWPIMKTNYTQWLIHIQLHSWKLLSENFILCGQYTFMIWLTEWLTSKVLTDTNKEFRGFVIN